MTPARLPLNLLPCHWHCASISLAGHRNWQIKIKLTVTVHLNATTRRLLMAFLRSHYGESELTLRSTGKYADVSSPVPCQVANFIWQQQISRYETIEQSRQELKYVLVPIPGLTASSMITSAPDQSCTSA